MPTLTKWGADWCSSCEALEPTLDRLENEGYTVIRMDVEQSPEEAKAAGVRTIPAIFIDGVRFTLPPLYFNLKGALDAG